VALYAIKGRSQTLVDIIVFMYFCIYFLCITVLHFWSNKQ